MYLISPPTVFEYSQKIHTPENFVILFSTLKVKPSSNDKTSNICELDEAILDASAYGSLSSTCAEEFWVEIVAATAGVISLCASVR